MKIVGLAFVRPEAAAISLQLSDKWTTHIFPSETFESWLESDHGGRSPVALLTNPKYFSELRRLDPPYCVALCGWSWLSARQIETLDAQPRGEGISVMNVKPSTLQSALKNADSYKPCLTDRWLARGAPRPDPKREKLEPQKRYHRYSLSNLIHIALAKSDESLLLMTPEEFWKATFLHALGIMPRKTWISRFSRGMKSAGVPRSDLTAISEWIKKYGDNLSEQKKERPVSTLDIKLAKEFSEAEEKILD
jgi:hypothetical protein